MPRRMWTSTLCASAVTVSPVQGETKNTNIAKIFGEGAGPLESTERMDAKVTSSRTAHESLMTAHEAPSIPGARGRIAYVGPFGGSLNSASAHRFLGIARAIQLAGYEVIMGSGERDDTPPESRTPWPFPVSYLNEMPRPGASKVGKAIRLLTWGGRTARWLETLSPRPHAVICYGGYTPYALHLLPCVRRLRIPFIFDVVEFMQPSHLALGRFGPFRLNVELMIRRYYPAAGNIIAISSHIHHYYESRGCRTIYVPPLFDLGRMPPPAHERDESLPLALAYAGDPGRKDLLDPVLEALLRLNARATRVRLHLAGLSEKQVLDYPAFRREPTRAVPDWLKAVGRIPSPQAQEMIRQADFTFLLRPHHRYSTAGFPTKVAESLALGTPLICNHTTDLGAYIRDGAEGIVCYGDDARAFEEAVERALAAGPRVWLEMKQKARRMAEASFDYRAYAPRLDRFIQGARPPA